MCCSVRIRVAEFCQWIRWFLKLASNDETVRSQQIRGQKAQLIANRHCQWPAGTVADSVSGPGRRSSAALSLGSGLGTGRSGLRDSATVDRDSDP